MGNYIIAKSKSKVSKLISGYAPFYLPIFLVYSVFLIVPAFMAFFYSMTDWTGVGGFNFIGLKNFLTIFTDGKTMEVFLQTLEYTFFSIVVGNAMGLLIALVFDMNLPTTNFTKTVFFLPFVFNALIIGYLWSYVYSPDGGIIYLALKALGLNSLAVPYLGMKSTVIPAVSFALNWQNTGSCALIYLAGLRSIPMQYYEAAHLDGASRFGAFRNVTIPLLMPAITINTLMGLVGTLKLFDIVFVMTNGGPGTSSDTVTTFIYRLAFSQYQFGYGTSVGVVLFLFIAVVSYVFTKFLRSREVEA